MIRDGKIRGFKIKYPDGIGYTIETVLVGEDGDDGCGICYDFPEEDVDSVIKVVSDLKSMEPEVYQPDEKYESFKKKREEQEKKRWYRIYMKLQDIGVHFTPFDWRWTKLLVSRPETYNKDNPLHMCKLCDGIWFGPICITWSAS